MIKISNIRKQFPIFNIDSKRLIYLDSAATSQRPLCVVKAMEEYYLQYNASIHRGVYKIAEHATKAYEGARGKIQKFINAENAAELVFTRNTTESINLVAESYGRACNIGKDDEIIISMMEHHSNIVPWQMLCEKTGAKLRVININNDGEILLDHYASLLSERTKIVAITHVSNVLGTINPIKQMIAAAHKLNIPVLIDGAQAVPHMQVDVQDLDCDFYAFSGHKMYGPTGIGVLYAKLPLLKNMPPYQGGGSMIKHVTFEKTEYADPPQKFEAGTPNIAGAIGLGAAIDFMQEIGMDVIAKREENLLAYANEKLKSIPTLKIIGTAKHKTGVISMVFPDIHPHDVATFLDSDNIALRASHHCAMPLMEHVSMPGTARVSFGIYNTEEEIDFLVKILKKVRKFFR